MADESVVSSATSLDSGGKPGIIGRMMWRVVGLLAVAVGAIGVVLPGLPTTVFFIIAAWAFSKSSPRLEAWVLGLPRIGPMVADHRSGLGMPRRAKRVAVSMIAVFVGLSFWAVGGAWVRWVILAAGVLGVAYVGFRVPTKERVATS